MNREWLISISIKLILLGILPLSIQISPGEFDYVSLLIRVDDLPYFFPPSYQEIDVLSVIVAFFVCLVPALAFNYLQYHKPRTESVGRSFALALLLTQQFIMYLLIYSLASLLFPVIAVYPNFMIGVIFALLAAPWTMLVFVIMPYFLRMMESPSAHYLSISHYELRFLGLISRYTLAAIVLSLGVGILPFYFMYIPTLVLQVFGSDVGLLSGSGMIEVYSYSSNVSISFSTFAGVTSFPVIISTIVFVYYSTEVFKYLTLKRTRQKTIVLGVILTTISAVSILLFPSYSFQGGVPIPSMFLISIVLMYKIDPMDSTEIWEGTSQRMRFESEDADTDRRDQPKVKIPLSYLIRSKLKRRVKAQEEFEWQDGEDVFDD